MALTDASFRSYSLSVSSPRAVPYVPPRSNSLYLFGTSAAASLGPYVVDMITPAVNIHRLGGWIIGTFQAAFLLFVVALTVAVGAWIFGSHIVLLGAISVGGLGLVVIGHVVTAAQRRLQ